MGTTLEEAEKNFKNAEEEVSALSRRIMLMEEEAKKADGSLAETVTKLALASKEADAILKQVKFFDNKTMNNEVEIEEADKNVRETTKMASDNEQKLEAVGENMKQLEISAEKAQEREEKLKDKIH